MEKRIFSCGVFLVVLFTAMVTLAFENQSWREPRNRIKTFIEVYGEIVYGAVYSLPETREVFIGSAGNRAWSSYSAEDVSGVLSFDEKKNIVAAISLALDKMPTKEQDNYFRRLDMWVAAEKVLSYSYNIACIESTMGAVYSVPFTQSLFDRIIENRRFDPQAISAMAVGATLTSGEISNIKYELLNKLSSLSRKDQVTYFRTLFDKLLTDPDLWGCLSPPDVGSSSSGEQDKK